MILQEQEFMIKRLLKKEAYSDTEVVEGLQHSDRRVEEWFYNTTRRYFNEHFNEVFFDKDKKQEIFQMAFLKLWTEYLFPAPPRAEVLRGKARKIFRRRRREERTF